jgi:hypothetical protein
MNKIEYKAKFLYQEFRGENLAEIIELLKYDSSIINEIVLRQENGLWIIGIILNNEGLNELGIFGKQVNILLKEDDILAYDNGIYKKVSKDEIEKIRKAELNNGK